MHQPQLERPSSPVNSCASDSLVTCYYQSDDFVEKQVHEHGSIGGRTLT